MQKLGLLAGGGDLPHAIAAWCERANRPLFVVRLKGFASPGLERYPGAEIGIAEYGRCLDALKKAGCEAVCLAGIVARPDFSALKPDLKGLAILPGAVAAARKGDDGLLRYLVGQFEKEGFRVEGADEVMLDLTLDEGALGALQPPPEALGDVARALEVARAIGRLDVGQGAVVADGLVLAVEAQEGTDAMLRRVAELPAEIRGAPDARQGVLAKAPKPIQERRVDLPTIGPRTVENAAAAGLAGIVGEAGSLIVLDREAVIETADRLGLFVWGVKSSAEAAE
ncbi:LpxI family protein [Caulobacter sp. 17J80-11]|uniref:UDP-2,3-diacylglucosamine diphosphatase n=1 Tax=Caulobacter sp. 17J80-11 TaxID=2763502 RepID=UPI0016539B97|nr:UDP-2,3-diacylglucosamine diphosphatase LpxI [Caulobacter sp. 17J80-11]MBC6980768.1 UDP-2,3-diacylglucosamine diphosphatase LpxI [Caulobacter sp. 17J80-11]